jgi:hypothetical protein
MSEQVDIGEFLDIEEGFDAGEWNNAPTDDYSKYRGKCKEMSEAAVAEDPTLTLVRGHYYCPIWGEQPHWWAKAPDGKIVDPTKDQFPSKGIGEYVEFNGRVKCSECGKDMAEEEASYESNYCFCSYECHGRFVGVF